MGILRSLTGSVRRSMREGQKAAAAREREKQAGARSAATVQLYIDALRESPYFRASDAPPGDRIPPLPPLPGGFDEDADWDIFEAAQRKMIAADRRLGLWTGTYQTDVVGCSYYGPAWDWLWEGVERPGPGITVPAAGELLPEPDNPHDEDAVRVSVGAVQIGHLSAGDAEDLVSKLSRRTRAGKPTFVRLELGYREASIPGIPEAE